jgi:hypothetical protein
MLHFLITLFAWLVKLAFTCLYAFVIHQAPAKNTFLKWLYAVLMYVLIVWAILHQ